MDLTKIVVAAFESGAVGHAVLLVVTTLLLRVVRQAMDPAVIREFSRRRVVKQIQESADGKFTPAQLSALLALLEPAPEDRKLPEKGKEPPDDPAG